MPSIQTQPAGPIQPRVGEEGRTNIAPNYSPIVQTAARALKAGFDDYKKHQLADSLVSDIDIQIEAVESDPTFGPLGLADDMARRIQTEEGLALSVEERSTLQMAAEVKEWSTEAIRQGADPALVGLKRLKNLRELVSRNPHMAPEILSIVNANSAILNDIQSGLAKADKLDDQLEKNRQEGRDKALMENGFTAVMRGMTGSQKDILYESVLGQHGRSVASRQQALASLRTDNDLTTAEREKRALEIVQGGSGALVAVQNANLLGIMAETIPVEQKIQKMQAAISRFEITARTDTKDLLSADRFDQHVGWYTKVAQGYVERLKGGASAEAIKNEIQIMSSVKLRGQFLESDQLLDAYTLTQNFGELLKSNPNATAELADAAADIAIKFLRRDDQPNPNPTLNPMTGAAADQRTTNLRHAQVVGLMGANVERLGKREAEALVADVADLSKQTTSYVAAISLIDTMSNTNYARLVGRSGVTGEKLDDAKKLAVGYYDQVERIVESRMGGLGLEDSAVNFRIKGNGTIELFKGPKWKGQRQQEQELQRYSIAMNNAIKAYAHASGSTDYRKAAMDMFNWDGSE